MDVNAIAQALKIDDDSFEDKFEFGVTYPSTTISATSAFVKVRGGGSGSRAWIARITGTHPTYGLCREFVEMERSLSRSGASGSTTFTYEGDGLYEFADATVGSNGYTKRGFFLVRDGKVAHLGNPRKTIEKLLAAQETAVAA